MKIPQVGRGRVQSLGRANTRAVAAAGAQAAATGRLQQDTMNMLAETAGDFIVRKQNAEYNTQVVEMQTEMNEWQTHYAAKQFYTSDELGDIPENQVPRSVTSNDQDGNEVVTKRDSIPAYEVYPRLLQQKLEGTTKTRSEKVSNPRMRREFLEKAAVINSDKTMRAMVAAETQQQAYILKENTYKAGAAYEAGDKTKGDFLVANLETDELTKTKLTTEGHKVWEWENDSRLLNAVPGEPGKMGEYIVSLQARLGQLQSEDYGKGEGDYLGPGSPSGSQNQAADIARFKRAINTATSTKTNTDSTRVEEHIDAYAAGGTNHQANIFYKEDGSMNIDVIKTYGFSASKEATLIRKAEIAQATGQASLVFRGTNIDDDKRSLDTAYQSLSTAHPDMQDEAAATYKAQKDAYDRKIERLQTDGAAYVLENSPVAQGALKKVNDLPEGADEQLRFQYQQQYLAVQRAEQQRLGSTREEVNFLGPRQVEGIRQQIAEAGRSPQGAGQAVQLMQQLESNYGPEFPAVYMQLLKENVLEDEHIAMMTYDSPAARVALSQVIVNKDAIIDNKLVREQKSDMESAIRTAMLPITQALIPVGTVPTANSGVGSHRQLNAIANAALLQVSNHVYSTGEWTAADVARYTTDIFEKEYTFDNEMRIPKNGLYDADKIVRGVGIIQNGRGYTFSDDVVFAVPSPTGLSPEDNQTRLKQQFGSGIRVVTNADETGVNYLWGSSGKPVEIMQGSRAVPLTSTFSDIETMRSGYRGRGTQSNVGNTLRLGPTEQP